MARPAADDALRLEGIRTTRALLKGMSRRMCSVVTGLTTGFGMTALHSNSREGLGGADDAVAHAFVTGQSAEFVDMLSVVVVLRSGATRVLGPWRGEEFGAAADGGPACGRFRFLREEFSRYGEGAASGRLCFTVPGAGTGAPTPTLLITDDGNRRVVELDVRPVLDRGAAPVYVGSFGGGPHSAPMAVAANGTHIAVAWWPPRGSTSTACAVTLYHAATREEVWTVSLNRPVALSFGVDGVSLAVVEQFSEMVKLLSVATGSVLAVMGDYEHIATAHTDVLSDVVGTAAGFVVVHRGVRFAHLIGAVDSGAVGAWQSPAAAKASSERDLDEETYDLWTSKFWRGCGSESSPDDDETWFDPVTMHVPDTPALGTGVIRVLALDNVPPARMARKAGVLMVEIDPLGGYFAPPDLPPCARVVVYELDSGLAR